MKKEILFWLITALTLAILWNFQSHILVNIPWWDDFHGIMLPVLDLFSELPIIEKFKSFFSLNNEHRVVTDRIMTALVVASTGRFELRLLALLGTLNLVFIAYLLFHVFKKRKLNSIYFLPAIFFIFQAQYYESLQSLMVPFQNFSVILFSFLSFYFLTFYRKRSFAIGFTFATLALFTHGNGLLALIIGAVILFIQKEKYWIWLVLSALVSTLYFWGYQKPKWVSTDTEHFSIKYVFEFLGAYIFNFTDLSTTLALSPIRSWLAALLGTGIVAALMLLFYRKYIRKSVNFSDFLNHLKQNRIQFFFYACTLFFVATAILIGISRSGFAVFSRYTLNSTLFFACVYLLFLVNFPKPRFAILVGLFSTFGLIASYENNIPKAINFRHTLEADAINFQKNRTWIAAYSNYNHVQRLNPLMEMVLKSNRYSFPESPLIDFDERPDFFMSEKFSFQITDGYLQIGNEKPIPNHLSTVFLTLENKKHAFIFPAYFRKNTIKDQVIQLKYWSQHFATSIPVNLLPPDSTYQIYYIKSENNKIEKYRTNYQLIERKLIAKRN